jgi:hypothetical protein
MKTLNLALDFRMRGGRVAYNGVVKHQSHTSHFLRRYLHRDRGSQWRFERFAKLFKKRARTYFV